MVESSTEINDQELLAQFKRYLLASDLAPVTVSNYLADLQVFARWLRRWAEGQASLLSINPADVRDYRVYLQETQCLSPGTINRHLQAIRKFAKFILANGLAESDPTVGLKRLREERASWGRMLSPDEMARLVEAVQNGRRSLVKRDLTIFLLVLLAPSTVEHLFLSQQGTPISARSVQRLSREYAAAAGLGEVPATTLRRTYAQTVWKKTGDLSQVARSLGHTRLNSTIRYMASSLEDTSGIKEKSSANVSQRR